MADSIPIPRTSPKGKITDPELIALAVAQAATGERSDRKFPGMIGYRLAGWFPHLPDQSQYNRRLRRLTPQITTVQIGVAQLVSEGRVRLADGTLTSCANYPGCAKTGDFAGHASYGYSPSHSQFVWGMRLREHPAKTFSGLVLQVAQRLLALTLGIYLNLLADRPARALAAYDGR